MALRAIQIFVVGPRDQQLVKVFRVTMQLRGHNAVVWRSKALYSVHSSLIIISCRPRNSGMGTDKGLLVPKDHW